MLTENTSPIIKIPLIGLPQQRVEGLQLFGTAIHSSNNGGDHKFESLKTIRSESSSLEEDGSEAKYIQHSFDLTTRFEHSHRE